MKYKHKHELDQIKKFFQRAINKRQFCAEAGTTYDYTNKILRGNAPATIPWLRKMQAAMEKYGSNLRIMSDDPEGAAKLFICNPSEQ